MSGSAESAPKRRFGQTREKSRIEFPLVQPMAAAEYSRRCAAGL
jgi:hypothetical protein